MFAKITIVLATGILALASGVQTPAPSQVTAHHFDLAAKHVAKGRAAKATHQRATAGAIRSANATLTAEQSAALEKAAACGDEANQSFEQVLAAVAVVNTTSVSFLDAMTAAVEAAQEKLLQIQGTSSSALQLAGVDDSFLGDFVDQISSKINDVLLAVNKSTEDVRSSLTTVIDNYCAEVDEINESLTQAVASAEEGLLAGAEKAEAAAAKNASEAFLTVKHSIIVLGPKASATKAIMHVNYTADKMLAMLTKLNSTLMAAFTDDAVDKVNSTATKLQDALTSAEDKFPDGVPSSVTDTINSAFDAVFALIAAIKPSDVDSQLTSNIEQASEDISSLEDCMAPLTTMVEDMDGAWHTAGSWVMLSILSGLALAHAAAL